MQLLLIGTALRSSNLTYMRAPAVFWSYLNLGLEYMSSLKKSVSDIVSWVAKRWVRTLGTVVCIWLTSTLSLVVPLRMAVGDWDSSGLATPN